MIHSPRFIALRKGPSLQVNLTVVLVSSGRSQPNSSDRSCRDGHTDHLCIRVNTYIQHTYIHTAHILHTHILYTGTYIHTHCTYYIHTYVRTRTYPHMHSQSALTDIFLSSCVRWPWPWRPPRWSSPLQVAPPTGGACGSAVLLADDGHWTWGLRGRGGRGVEEGVEEGMEEGVEGRSEGGMEGMYG